MWETAGNATALDTRCRNPRRVSFIAEPRSSCSFNYLVGAGEQSGRNFEAEGRRGLGINYQFDLTRRLDRQIVWLSASEYPVNIGRGAAQRVNPISPVGYQSARCNE